MNRHWSFIVVSKRVLYPLAAAWLVIGLALAVAQRDPEYLNRFGNFIIGTGVWMSMRFTLREGISRHKSLADSSPTVSGSRQLNPNYFNREVFVLGDAILQVHGFVLVIAGSVVGSFGDLALKRLLPNYFQ